MSKGRNNQSARLMVIQQMLTASGTRGLSPAEIQERLIDRGYSTSKRTIHRDLVGLQVAGIPVAESGSKTDAGGVRWKVDIQNSAVRAGHSAALKVSQQQLVGLYLAKSLFKAMARNPMFAGLDHFFERISDLIGSRNRALLDEFSKTVHVSQSDSQMVDSNPDFLDTMRAAIEEGHCLRVTYRSASSGTERERILGPHYVYVKGQGIYLVAEDMEAHEVKTFAVPRMTDVCMLDEAYTGQVSTPEKFFGDSFGAWHASQAVTARVKFKSARTAFLKERLWHPSQKITEHQDGSTTMELRVGITPNFVGWILSFGNDAEVEGPVELCDATRKEAQSILNKYLRNAG